MSAIFRALDRFYAVCGFLAATCMVLMLTMISLQIAGVLLSFNISGSDAYAVYLLSATTFLGLAQTLAMGQHIRVTLMLERAGPALSRGLDIAAHVIGALLVILMAFVMVRLVWQSHRFGDLSHNLDATPLWIPQAVSAFGAVAFAVAAVDRTVRLVLGMERAGEDGPLQSE